MNVASPCEAPSLAISARLAGACFHTLVGTPPTMTVSNSNLPPGAHNSDSISPSDNTGQFLEIGIATTSGAKVSIKFNSPTQRLNRARTVGYNIAAACRQSASSRIRSGASENWFQLKIVFPSACD